MTPNVCGTEKRVRFILGSILLVLGIVFGSWFLAVIGVIPILTAAFSYCPLNHAFNKNSCLIPTDHFQKKNLTMPNMGPNMGGNVGSDFT